MNTKIYLKFIPDIHFADHNSPCMKDCSIEMNSAVENCRRIVLGHIGRTIARSDRAGFVVSRYHDHPDNLDAAVDIRMPPGQLAELASVPGLVLVAVVGLWH